MAIHDAGPESTTRTAAEMGAGQDRPNEVGPWGGVNNVSPLRTRTNGRAAPSLASREPLEFAQLLVERLVLDALYQQRHPDAVLADADRDPPGLAHSLHERRVMVEAALLDLGDHRARQDRRPTVASNCTPRSSVTRSAHACPTSVTERSRCAALVRTAARPDGACSASSGVPRGSSVSSASVADRCLSSGPPRFRLDLEERQPAIDVQSAPHLVPHGLAVMMPPIQVEAPACRSRACDTGAVADRRSPAPDSRALLVLRQRIALAHEHSNPAGGIQWNEPVVIAALAKPPNRWDEAKVRHRLWLRQERQGMPGFAACRRSLMYKHAWVAGAEDSG